MSSIDWYKILGYIMYPLGCTGGGKGYVALCIIRSKTKKTFCREKSEENVKLYHQNNKLQSNR